MATLGKDSPVLGSVSGPLAALEGLLVDSVSPPGGAFV